MSIRNLIAEAISLTQYTDNFELAIYQSYTTVLNNSQHQLAATNAVTNAKNSTIAKLIDSYETLLSDSLATVMADNLHSVCQTIPNVTVNTVSVQPLSSDGAANKLDIFINRKYTNELINQLIDLIYDRIPSNIMKSPAAPQTCSQVFDIITKELIPVATRSKPMQSIISEIANIFIHELVHVSQNSPQVNKKRDSLAYTSYLDNKKLKGSRNELHSLNTQGDRSPRFFQLYYASPQEMAAYAHNIAQNIIREFRIEKRNRPPINTVAQVIPDKVRVYMNPTNSKEQSIFNRYVKLVYKELDSYYTSITTPKS